MKIVLICPWFYPNLERGGTPIAAYNFAKGLASKGADVTVLTTSNFAAGRFRGDAVSSVGGLKVRYLDPWLTLLPRAELFSIRILFFMFLLRDRDAIYYLHTSRNSYSVFCLFLQKLNLIKGYVICPHGSYSSKWIDDIGFPKVKKIYMMLIERFIVQNALAIHFLDEVECDRTDPSLYINKKIIVPNAIKMDDKIPPNVDFESQKLRCVFIGRIHPQKNLKNIIAAVIRMGGLVSLDIYGPIDDEYYAEDLELNNTQNITYHGFLDNADVVETLKNYDIFVLCSLVEGVSIALLEALSCGMPVLYSEGLANASDLTSYGVGVGIGEGTTENIVGGFKTLINEKQKLAIYSSNALQLCKEIYSEERVANDLYHEFDNLMSKKRT